MKANDYKSAKDIFREKGYEFVKGWIAELDKRNIVLRTEREIEAKRLVESHNLIEGFGSLEDAKEYEKMFGHGLFTQAIADVESCMPTNTNQVTS